MTITAKNALTLATNNRALLRDLVIFSLFMLLLIVSAHAEVTVSTGGAGTSTIGQDGWNSVKGLWFGPAGLILGAAVFALSVYFFFKEGVLAVLGVLAIGTFFFFVPAMVVSIQTYARSF